MNRKTFLRQCGLACLGAGYMVSFLESCGSTKRLQAAIQGSDMVVDAGEFVMKEKDGEIQYARAIILNNDQLNHPICLFRHPGTAQYTAFLMQCTHQGSQLQLFGDKFQCPAHGSEFDNQGHVQQGPAETDLRSFPVTVENQLIKISLR
jgi:Rieske Fe-S protein